MKARREKARATHGAVRWVRWAYLAVMSATMTVTMTGGLACERAPKTDAKAVAKPAQTGELATPVAKIDDVVITLGDFQDEINRQAPFVRARYTSPDKKKEFLDNLVRIEVLAREAEKRGYDKDPEVVRAMKQQMIAKFMRKDFESKLRVEDVPDADVEKYYKEHADQFSRPDEVRVSQILVKDKGKADRAERDAVAANKTDPKAFRELVTKYSEDEDSKARGGDLMSFDRNAVAIPKPIVEAAFALKEVGDVSPVVKTDRGFAVLRLTQKRAGFVRPIAEVKRQIQQQLFRDVRTKGMEAFVADVRSKHTVTIDEAALAKVAVDSNVTIPGPGAADPLAAMKLPGAPVGAAPSSGPTIPAAAHGMPGVPASATGVRAGAPAPATSPAGGPAPGPAAAPARPPTAAPAQPPTAAPKQP